MRRVLLPMLAVTGLLLMLAAPGRAATVKVGAPCAKAGAKATVAGRPFVCKRTSKGLRWQRVVVVPKPEPSVEVTPPAPVYPPVTGPDPSPKVMAFYYAWYDTPKFGGIYLEWDNDRLKTHAPDDITSDYMPELGVYSSSDPEVIAQHMAWLRRAGVGVAVVSYHFSRPFDWQIKMYLDMAQRYGIKLAFMMEPDSGRNAAVLVEHVNRLTKDYGDHPAFFKTNATGPWLTGSEPKPLFFVWAIQVPAIGDSWVPPEYWTDAIDTIHRQSNALMISTSSTAGYDGAITRAHFDGAFNYITIDLIKEGGFDWARTLPKGALYVPSVAPGNYAARVQYPPESTLRREDGAAYDHQWNAALGTGIQPDFVTITSFNEWHEGSQIEPPRPAFTTPSGRKYLDYGAVGPYFYLDQTAKWVKTFSSSSYSSPTRHELRVTITSTSDWAGLQVTKGEWIRPGLVSKSGPSTTCRFNGKELFTEQPIPQAMSGTVASCTWEISAMTEVIEMYGESGNIGASSASVAQPAGNTWRAVSEWNWTGTVNPLTRYTFTRG